MSKGLQLTLVTVAVVLMGMSAMATAPVIDDIPSPIVGGGELTTPPNTFVYPNALNLNSYVQDDGGDANIVWSYEVTGTQIYSINGNDPIDSGSEDPTDPTGKDLNTVRNGEEDPDSNPITITIRNVNLSPIGGPNTDPGDTAGIISSETQVVTLYASDGSTYSQTEIMVYTDNEGEDRLSGEPTGGIPVIELDFTNNANGFTSMAVGTVGATATLEGNGICIEVAAGGNNLGTWTSPWAFIDLAANSVYHIRADVNGTQTTAGLVPLWDVIIQNFDNLTGANGAYAYFADYYFLDNEGGAYAVGPATGISRVDMYFAPLPAKLASWNDESAGAFTATNDAMNDMQMIFRVLDADESAQYGGELDVGQICLQLIDIDRYDLDTGVTRGTVVLDNEMNNTNYFALGLTGQTDIDWSTAGQLTWGPSASFSGVELMNLTPGDDGDIYAGGNADILFPISWADDKLYLVEVVVSAPSAGDEVDPVDVITIGMDPPTWENFMINAVTRADGTMHNIAMPKAGDPDPYVSFFRSDRASFTGEARFNRLRPRMQVLNSDDLVYNGQTESTGKFTVHDIIVTEVTVP